MPVVTTLSPAQIMTKEPSATKEWVKLEAAKLPHFTIGNITTYFISRLATDGTKANDYKNLNTHAYPLFKAGHIQSILVSCKGNHFFIKCICLPEMKKDIVYSLELTLDNSGDIVSASCGCPAGGKPYGSCKHISALCYALEEYSRMKETCQTDSCTSRLQEWNHPRKRRLPPQEVEDITFVKEEYGKTKRQLQSMAYDPRPTEFQCTTTTEVKLLRDTLSASGKDIAFVHLLPLTNSNEGKTFNQWLFLSTCMT